MSETIKQNYGGIWTSQIKETLELNCNGLNDKQLLQLFAKLQIWPDKAKELIRQFKEIDYLKYENNLWYYHEPEINVISPNILKIKDKTEEQEYEEYVADMIKKGAKERIKNYDAWLKDKSKIEEFDKESAKKK